MDERCLNCDQETQYNYLINQVGDLFCSEECYEKFANEHIVPNDDHPYFDDYRLARGQYLDWMNWESELNSSNCSSWDVNVMIEQLDGIIASFHDYIYTEGDDGPYAWEIYQYSCKLRGFQLQIIDWYPKHREVFYYIYIDDLEKLTKSLLEKDVPAEELWEKQHNYRENYFIFIDEVHRNSWLTIIKDDGYDIDNDISEGYLYYCEGQCTDIIDEDEIDIGKHWITCYDCDDMTIMTHEELKKELVASYEHLKFFDTWWKPYKLKVKKSCLKYGEEYPSWVNLGDDYLDYVN